MDDDTAAVIFETIPATLGITIPPEDFFAGVRRLCDRYEVIMIQDEVQTGLGRCGAVWGIDTYNVVPDIIVTGKGLSGGIYPITATLYREHLNPFMHANPFIHISTFGGAEVGCYAALEVLDILEEPGFLEHVRTDGGSFRGWLCRSAREAPGCPGGGAPARADDGFEAGGPIWAVDYRSGFDAGLLVIFANNDPSAVQILPPLIIQEEQAQQVLGILDGMLAGLEETFG